VTGVQTCALPILGWVGGRSRSPGLALGRLGFESLCACVAESPSRMRLLSGIGCVPGSVEPAPGARGAWLASAAGTASRHAANNPAQRGVNGKTCIVVSLAGDRRSKRHAAT